MLSTPRRPFIVLNDITLQLAGKPLFAHTNWALHTGEHWAVMGPNGAGKSLLADALQRNKPLLAGRITYYFDRGHEGRTHLEPGEIIRISQESLLRLLQGQGGYHQARWQSFEGQGAPTVADVLTGKSIENRLPFETAATVSDEPAYRKKREKAVALLGIEPLLDRKLLHLSHGEARKVLIARALMQQPQLLILDDPFRGLDTDSQARLRHTIELLIADGATQVMLIVARSQDIPEGISHLLCVAGQKVTAQGPKEALLPCLFGMGDSGTQSFPPTEREQPFPAMRHSRLASSVALIEMNGVGVRYGDVTVLHEITWCMRRNEHWAVLGPNGAGKTTLLSLILADNPQGYANDMSLFGRRRGSGESIWDIKKRIGWVSPELQLYYYRNIPCYQVVCSGFFDTIGLYTDCSGDRSALARQWMQSLAIGHLANRTFRSVSAGEQRLTLLARALVKQPTLLVLDEPCQGLDTAHRHRIRSLLDRLCRQTPVSLIYVTHQWEELPDSISHVLKLAQGKMVSCGPKKR
jgi:molybdate transport system ATP-binding protein